MKYTCMRWPWTFIRMREFSLPINIMSYGKQHLSEVAWLHEHHNLWWWVLDVGTTQKNKSFRHFPYNENPTRALNTSSLKCNFPPPDTINRQEEIHTCIGGFKVASCKHASLKSTKFVQKKNKVRYFSNRVLYRFFSSI